MERRPAITVLTYIFNIACTVHMLLTTVTLYGW